jgi:hypothetical protein
VTHGDDGHPSAGSRPFPVLLLEGTLVHKLPVDGREDSLLALPEPRVSLGRLYHRHHRLRGRLVSREVAEIARKGVRGEPEDSLQFGNPPGLRCGLAGDPLGDRCLGDAKRGRKLALRQAALGASALERPCKVVPLIGRRHLIVLSQALGHVNRMPDQPITGRFPRADKSIAVRRPLGTYTVPREPGSTRGSGPTGLLHGEGP